MSSNVSWVANATNSTKCKNISGEYFGTSINLVSANEDNHDDTKNNDSKQRMASQLTFNC